MPLIPSILADGYESAWKSKSPSETVTAQKEAKNLGSFVDSGMTAMAGTPTSAPGIPGLASELDAHWKGKLPTEDLVAKKESISIHNLMMGLITKGGKHGIGGFMLGTPSALGEGLAGVYKSKLPTERLVALKKVQVIDSYIKSIVFRGSGVAPDYTPDISGLT